MKKIIIDKASAVKRVGDIEIYNEIALSFASHMPDYIQKLQNNLNEKNLIDLSRIIHSIKSNCATVGAEDIREMCYELEKVSRNEKFTESKELLEKLKPILESLATELKKNSI